MARLTLEELKKDPLTKGDFERMKIMGLDANEPWALVCKILDFCDDGYFNMRALNLFSIYVTGYFDCYRRLNSEKIEKLKRLLNYERYVLYMLSCCYAYSCSCCRDNQLRKQDSMRQESYNEI